MRRTKIIATLGPATNEWRSIEAMYRQGMNAIRLNMSHASYDEMLDSVRWVRTLNKKVKYAVPIIFDTCGPEIRTGDLDQPQILKAGQRVTLAAGYPPLGIKNPFVEIRYNDFANAVSAGDKIKLDNGLIDLEVKEKSGINVECEVIDGGTLHSRKHVNLPGIHVNLPSITSKDQQDIEFAKEHDASFIAQSFVRKPEDIEAMRELLGPKRNRIKIIAKIENFEGVDQLSAIARAADGVMVARGDLGVETNMAAMPVLQRRMVETTMSLGRRCIVATHLLESMTEQPIPTRAEVVDVANAINQGVDGVLLSAETSIGRFPVRAVKFMRQIAEEQENSRSVAHMSPSGSNDYRQLLAWAAVELAERIRAVGIVVVTRSGYAADLVTNCAPPSVPIFAFSNASYSRRQLMLNRSVYAYRISFSKQPEVTIARAFTVLRDREGLSSSDSVIVISSLSDASNIDSITIRQLGDDLEPLN